MVNNVLRDHLQFVKDHGSCTVSDFKQAFDLGHSSRSLLEGYATSGLLVRKWQQARGTYYITPEGEQTLRELITAANQVKSKNASTSASKQSGGES